MKIIKSTFTDPRDNRVYKTIKIPEIGREWFAENLDYDPRVGLNNLVLDIFGIDPGCWSYNNNEDLRKKYGLLYSFKESINACPPGWTIPHREEFTRILWKAITKKEPHEMGEKDYQIIFNCSTKDLGKNGIGLNILPAGQYSSPIKNMYNPKDFTFFGLYTRGIYWTATRGTFDNGGSAFVFDFENKLLSESVFYGAFSIRPIRYITKDI